MLWKQISFKLFIELQACPIKTISSSFFHEKTLAFQEKIISQACGSPLENQAWERSSNTNEWMTSCSSSEVCGAKQTVTLGLRINRENFLHSKWPGDDVISIIVLCASFFLSCSCSEWTLHLPHRLYVFYHDFYCPSSSSYSNKHKEEENFCTITKNFFIAHFLILFI